MLTRWTKWLLVAVPVALSAQPAPAVAQGARRVTSLNDGWRFTPSTPSYAEKPYTLDDGWQAVSLPHTWNAVDPFDDEPGYRRGTSWYRRWFAVDSTANRRHVIRFEGVNQAADVYVNGAWAGSHRGGYTAFSVDVTKWVVAGQRNLLAVRADNSHDPAVPPLSVGFVLYGGIYRDVWLESTADVHLQRDAHDGVAVSVRTPRVDSARAAVAVAVRLRNDSPRRRVLWVRSAVTDVTGRTLAADSTALELEPGSETVADLPQLSVAKPQLWAPDTPTLHRVRTEVIEGGTVLDASEEPLGFRWFSFDAQGGFRLNGKRLVLRGTNRHQDEEGKGSALTDAEHRRDLRLIKAMGANFLRLAHYPQDPAVLEEADRIGLLLWEEIPVVNYVTRDSAFTRQAVAMLHEMIGQHRNHPSVVMWGVMNEPFLWNEAGFRARRMEDTSYMRSVRDLARRLDAEARAADPTRVTAMAIHGSADYERAGVSSITQVLGVNVYDGWYQGTFDAMGRGLDQRHARAPTQPLFVSEYGAEDDWRVNSLTPERFDFSGTWMRRYHESYLRQIVARPWLAGTAVWNQFDFGYSEVGGSIPHRNQKGLMTWAREPKDAYFVYQANWTSVPMVHIASRTWVQRTGTDLAAPRGAGPRAVTQPVDVYSNLESVELLQNGRSLGVKRPDDVRRATWDVPFTAGANVLVARGAGSSSTIVDQLAINFTYRPPQLDDPSVPFRELAVNVGGHAEVADADGTVWVADQSYAPKAFGAVGGVLKQVDREMPITHTRDTPVFFTYRDSIQAFRFDVPDGTYELELRFVEPEFDVDGERVFDVVANGVPVVTALDLASRAGRGGAVTLRAVVAAAGGDGVQVRFEPRHGSAVLSAIRVLRK